MIDALISWLAHHLIEGWLNDGSPDGWRFRMICRAWAIDDRRSNPDSWVD